MNLRRASLLLFAVAGVLAAAGTIRFMVAGAQVAAERVSVPGASAVPAPASAEQSRVLAARVVERNPFRLARRPSSVTYTPRGAQAEPRGPSSNSVPQVALAGIAGGPPWRAILRAWGAGAASRLVAVDDTVAGFRVAAIERDSVVLVGLDTTLTLRMVRR